jgi:hypothetical protein
MECWSNGELEYREKLLRVAGYEFRVKIFFNITRNAQLVTRNSFREAITIESFWPRFLFIINLGQQITQ